MNLIFTFNTILQCFLNWDYRSQFPQDMPVPECCVAFSFGKHPYANSQMAMILSQTRCPSIVQASIASSYPYSKNSSDTILAHRASDTAYVDKGFALEEISNICNSRGFHTIGVIAHPIQQWRLCKMLEKKGFSSFPIHCYVVHDNFWYGSKIRLMPIEIVKRLIFLFRNWI